MTAREHTRLGLLIGTQRWLVDLEQAGEIVPVPATIVPVPLTRDWLLGLVNVRGALYTVVDLYRFVGAPATESGKDARLLALGLRNIAAMQPDDSGSSPQDLRAQPLPPWVGPARIDAEGHRWFELDMTRLVSGPDFLLVGR